MTDIEALKESVSEKLYAQEPLAQAILSYLNNSDPAAHQAILNRFDEIVSARIDCLIQEALENEANTEKCRLGVEIFNSIYGVEFLLPCTP